MDRLHRAWGLLTADPRHGQIATLASLLCYGGLWLEFDIGVLQSAVTIATALAVQRVGDGWVGAPWRSGAKSALISALSLCLLLRTDQLWWAAAGAGLAVSSKFLVRARGKHIFNPTNGALVALLLLTDEVWVSPGQWGTGATFAFAMACAGLAVVHRSTRSDVTLAFLAAYATLLVGRSLSLGEPMTIPMHRLQSGAFLLFSFFMISDPRTTPDSRLGRVLFACLVAWGAFYVHFRLFRPNGFLWALACASPLVPLLDRLLPALRFQWPGASRVVVPVWRSPMLRKSVVCVLVALGLASATRAEAFCGFYVSRADTSLFNKASQVVLVRDGDRTVLTMANDFRGDPREFAMVIPVPTAITREQIHVADAGLVSHLDAYTAPRLVEYFDADPCALYDRYPLSAAPLAEEKRMRGTRQDRDQLAKSLGVTIEAQYSVGEYDILILSATQSAGLATWLRDNGYRIPAGATDVLATYIGQRMRFFVAKVNLKEQTALGFRTLRPLQVAYESPKFMLPIRLGMVNADGPQELFIYALTRKGRVESTNYRTVKLRSDVEIPTYVKDPAEFGRMYRALFDQQVKREHMTAVFQEYAWDMAWCDPCAADPFTSDELRRLGVMWIDDRGGDRASMPRGGGAQDVFVTRLHVRYDKAHFPEDLVFQETGDRTNFQGRYVLRHAYTGPATCDAAVTYRRTLRDRHEREAQTLASLTGWSIEEIRRRMGATPVGPAEPRVGDRDQAPRAEPLPVSWWRKLWGR